MENMDTDIKCLGLRYVFGMCVLDCHQLCGGPFDKHASESSKGHFLVI